MKAPWEKYKAGGSGPWEKFALPKEEKGPGFLKQAESFVQGLGSKAAFGYGPELQAAGEAVTEFLTPKPKDVQELEAQGFKVQGAPKPTFGERVKGFEAREERLAEEAPVAYGAGGLLGTVAGAVPAASGTMALAGKAIPAAAKLGTVGQAALTSGVQGALEKQEGDLGDRVQSGLLSAAMGGGFAKGAELAGKGLQSFSKIPKTLEKYGYKKAFKATGPVMKDVKRAMARGDDFIDDVGRELMDRGIVKPGATFEDIAEGADAVRRQAGERIGEVYNRVSEELSDPKTFFKLKPDAQKLIRETNLNPTEFADEMLVKFGDELKGKPSGKKVLAHVEGLLDDLRANGDITGIKEMQEFKSGLDDLIKYNKDIADEPLSKQYTKKVRDFLSDKIQARVDAFDKAMGGKGELLQELKTQNRLYGIMSEAQRNARERIMRESGNRFVSLTDTIAGAGGGAVGGAIGAATADNPEEALERGLKGALVGSLAGGINKAGRLYGNPLLARGAQKAGQALGKVPGRGLIEAGGKALERSAPAAGLIMERMRRQ
jgi:hypothetical protein